MTVSRESRQYKKVNKQNKKKEKPKVKPIENKWIEVQVTKKGVDTVQMTTLEVFVKILENNDTKNTDRKGKLRKNN